MYAAIKDCPFTLTTVYEPHIIELGMDTEFLLIFAEIGWENF
jgi:hypothetical protein